MKKFFLLFICSLFVLSGCKKTDDVNSEEKLAMYKSYYQAVLDNAEFEEFSRYYNISYDVTNSNGKYIYNVYIDNPQIAMYDVEIIVLEGIKDYDENAMMPSVGIFDSSEYNMIPYQSNTDKGYVKGFVVSGDMDSLNEHLYVLITWKDLTRLNVSREFLEIILNDGSSDEPHDAEE